MARSVPWRRAVSDACNWHQTQALDSTIYILRQTGPTGFLLKEEGERKNVKVFMGDPHTCTCPVFKKERDLCKHICWLLLRKFRLSVNDPLSWQLGLVEREINEILRGRVTAERPQHQAQAKQSLTNQTVNGRPVVEQREIAEEDVCPICQEELLAKKLPVTYCKFACGNSIHIKCMQVWAEHQQKSSPEGTIKCPMCREDFGPLDLLKTEMRNSGCRRDPPPGIRMDRHLGVMCSNCSKAPIEGKCYRCMVCPTYHLCQRCFNFPIHTNHSFQFRQKRNQRWRSAQRTLGSSLPDALVNDLMRREITDNDYDMLLQMERNDQEELSNLSLEDLNDIPLEKVRVGGLLLSPGMQCRVCLRGFAIGQTVRKLPCKHRFHQDCIDSWLLHSHPTCPIDGLAVVVHVDVENSLPSSDNHLLAALTHSSAISTGRGGSDQGLVLTAMGIPVSASRSHRGDSLTRNGQQQQQHLGRSHVSSGPDGQAVTGVGLELLGVGVTLGTTGARGDNDTTNSDAVGTSMLTSAVPGGRLLMQAAQHRRRLAASRMQRLVGHHQSQQSDDLRQHYDMLPHPESRLALTGVQPQGLALSTRASNPCQNVPAVSMAGQDDEMSIAAVAAEQLTPAALVSFLQSDVLLSDLDTESAQLQVQGEEGGRRLSAASRGSVQSDSAFGANSQNIGRSRRATGRTAAAANPRVLRPRSVERFALNTSQNSGKELQDIYLGNNPRNQPAIIEEYGPTTNSRFARPPPGPKPKTRLFRSAFHEQGTRPSIQSTAARESNIRLEGSGFSSNDTMN